MTKLGGTSFLSGNAFALGLVVGICVPIAAYGILLTIYDFLDAHLIASDIGFAPEFRTRTLMLIAICSNLIPFHVYQRRRADNTMRGMVLPTIVYVGVWFYLFGRHLVGI
jgi:hypothetical protein